jgi:hypothetical protein
MALVGKGVTCVDQGYASLSGELDIVLQLSVRLVGCRKFFCSYTGTVGLFTSPDYHSNQSYLLKTLSILFVPRPLRL